MLDFIFAMLRKQTGRYSKAIKLGRNTTNIRLKSQVVNQQAELYWSTASNFLGSTSQLGSFTYVHFATFFKTKIEVILWDLDSTH